MQNPSPICDSVALGWQVAELFHLPVHDGPAVLPEQAKRLPGRSDVPAATTSLWLAEEIAARANVLCSAAGQDGPLAASLKAFVPAFESEGRSRDSALDALLDVHCRLMEQLQILDLRLAKAYDLGRELAESALVPGHATLEAAPGQFKELFSTGRLITIRRTLFDLKSLLPDHAALGISRNLDDWQNWVENSGSRDWTAAKASVRAQGQIWRGLLTGEKAATDLLDISDYIEAGKRVARTCLKTLLAHRWVLALPLITIAGVAVAFAVPGVSKSVREVTSLAWVAVVIGVAAKEAGSALSAALKDVEGWLWQSELDEAVASAALSVPAGGPAVLAVPVAGAMKLVLGEPNPSKPTDEPPA